MLSQYIDNLENTIQWAQYQDDIDVLKLARHHMDTLMAFASTLPVPEQVRIHQKLDQVLPMEWPLWMEACRYEDGAAVSVQSATLH